MDSASVVRSAIEGKSGRRLTTKAYRKCGKAPATWEGGGKGRSAQPGDVGQVPEALVPVQAVAHHEHVGDLPTHVVEGELL